MEERQESQQKAKGTQTRTENDSRALKSLGREKEKGNIGFCEEYK